jgi:hypothetical protein
VKLLFDENLSRKLVVRLAELYPDSAHVVEFELLESPDRKIWELARSIVIASLEEINRLIGNSVNQAMFLGDTPRPTTCKHKSERLGLAWAFQWIPHHCFHKIQHSDRSAPFRLGPKPQILPELRLKNRDALSVAFHRASLAVIPQPFLA